LTKLETKDGTQAIRMMGGNLWQRSTLTVNNGTYYLDTAAGAGKQAKSPLKNIFEAGRTYYVFLVYAKPTTHQVYQMYVGKNLPFDLNTNVFLTRVLPNGSHFEFTDDTANRDWPATWDRKYKSDTGILTVTIDMGFEQFAHQFKQAEKDFCQPGSFCQLDGERCLCNENGPYAAVCKENDICSQWAGKDIDWPAGGIYGFGVKFPAGFVADDLDHRLDTTTTCLRQVDTGWDAPLMSASKDLAGTCFNASISPTQFCP
jgi:hypothetical protein